MIKKRIEAELRVLIGQPLIDIGRAALQWFTFGPSHTITGPQNCTQEVREYALHIQCPWRITGPYGIVAGSGDLSYAAGDDPHARIPAWKLARQGENRCDERVRMLLYHARQHALIVEEVHADDVGSLTIHFNAGYTLAVFPNDTLEEEYWRFFRPYADEPHFLVTGQGIEQA
jgi:hypothetical protein